MNLIILNYLKDPLLHSGFYWLQGAYISVVFREISLTGNFDKYRKFTAVNFLYLNFYDL